MPTCFHRRVTDESVAIPAQEYYAKRVRYYLAERGIEEQVVSSVPMYPAGTTRSTFAKDMGGLLGTVAGGGSSQGMALGRTLGRRAGVEANRLQGGGVVRSPITFPKRSHLVMTSGRLLIFGIWSMGFFTGKPKKDAAVDVPLTEILWVSAPEAQSGGYATVVRLDVCVRDRGFLHMEVPGGGKRGMAFGAELGRRVDALNAPAA